MGKLAAVTFETSKPNKARDRLLGDGDELFLRMRTHGTKIWLIEYQFRGVRRKYTIGAYDTAGSPGESISDWLRYGRLSLTQARSTAGSWKTPRRGGHDPVVEWEAVLAGENAADSARLAVVAAKASQTSRYYRRPK